MKKILITAGGGGHFAPALCVIESLPKNVEVLLVGAAYALEGDSATSFEYKTAKEIGIPFVSLKTGRLQRKLTLHTIPSLLKIPYGFYQAIKILKSFSPDVVLAFGGYVSIPIVFAASIFRIPVVIHEQTLEAGMANKITSHFAKKICISWESSRQFFPKEKTVLTGNPIRKFTVHSSQFTVQNEEKLPVIYVTGGSLGSHAINVLVEGCVQKLLERYVVIHQTGDAKQFEDFDRLSTLRNSLSKQLQNRYQLVKFIQPKDLGAILEKADLVIGRSGINTVTDLIAIGKPALLIPLPFSQKNEQLKNALFLKSLGIGEVLLQHDATPSIMHEKIQSMLEHKKQYEASAKKAAAEITPDATKKIMTVVESVVNEK